MCDEPEQIGGKMETIATAKKLDNFHSTPRLWIVGLACCGIYEQ
jgi:hypothetical protein